MFMQKHGNKHWPIAYYSIQLDTVAHDYSICLRAITTSVKLVETSADITLGNDTFSQTLCTVQSLFNSEFLNISLQAD